MKWIIEADKTQLVNGNAYYYVRAEGAEHCDRAWVYYDTDTGRSYCGSCSEGASPISSSCRHAKAIKRHGDKIYNPTTNRLKS